VNVPTTTWSEWLARVDEEVVEPDLRIVDTHLHLWPSDRPYPTGVMDRLVPYGADELSADVTGGGHKIVRTVFVECGSAYRQSGPPHLAPVGETEYVAGVARTHPDTRLGAIVPTADLRLDELDEVLDAHEEAGEGLFRGIRHAIARAADPQGVRGFDSPNNLAADPAFRRGVARLGERGLLYESWQFHYQASEFLELARAVPETTMVLEHLCTPMGVKDWSDPRDPVFVEWKRGIQEIASCPNVVAKLGGTVLPHMGLGWDTEDRPRTSDEYLAGQRLYYEHMLESFGPERCMFESNFSVDQLALNYRTLWNAYKKLTQGFSASERAEMFEGTATRVYRL
jgi:L-fuconolactonase